MLWRCNLGYYNWSCEDFCKGHGDMIATISIVYFAGVLADAMEILLLLQVQCLCQRITPHHKEDSQIMPEIAKVPIISSRKTVIHEGHNSEGNIMSIVTGVTQMTEVESIANVSESNTTKVAVNEPKNNVLFETTTNTPEKSGIINDKRDEIEVVNQLKQPKSFGCN
ncbi:hypothetical protein QVD17_21175 [Tagetes erecta]|uniref:Uncharacterized protein n=1 Tax=Tagetes erecta TaxID=13708 RepID=A0AAD8KN28_TARER|nr:hypothetical protein QVD17_21175 [Tagetes erecta]